MVGGNNWRLLVGVSAFMNWPFCSSRLSKCDMEVELFDKVLRFMYIIR